MRSFPVLIAAAMLSACATPPETRPEQARPRPVQKCPSPPEITVSPVETLLKYHARLVSLSQNDLVAEFHKARLSAASDELQRIRFAVLLTLPGTAFRDLQKAEELLKGPIGDPLLADFAALLGAQIHEERLSDSAAHGLAKMLREEKKRAESLQGKIDAIKNLERNIIQREKR